MFVLLTSVVFLHVYTSKHYKPLHTYAVKRPRCMIKLPWSKQVTTGQLRSGKYLCTQHKLLWNYVT